MSSHQETRGQGANGCQGMYSVGASQSGEQTAHRLGITLEEGRIGLERGRNMWICDRG